MSKEFAVADHQIAHVYVAEPSLVPDVRALLASLPGVERVYDDTDKRTVDLDHPRAGELIAMETSDPGSLKADNRAPDFARTVEIHRKPVYDPVELANVRFR